MARQEFPENTQLRFNGEFTIDGVLTDPSTIRAAFRHEDGTEYAFIFLTDSEVGKKATGQYFADWIPPLSGVWWYGFKGEGEVTAAWEEQFFIREAKVNFTPS